LARYIGVALLTISILSAVIPGQLPGVGRVSQGGELVGRVTDATTGELIVGSQVTARLRPGPVFSTRSDGRGRFAFAQLPGGRYELTAAKPGYRGGGFGQRSSVGIPQPVAVAAPGRVAGLELRVWKCAVVTGRFTDELGEPAVDSPVVALQERAIGGERHLVLAPAKRARTDDQGIYRLVDLAPGNYVIAAPSSAARLPMDTQHPQAVVYPTSYFPSTLDPSMAGEISLGAAEERSGVDFQFASVPHRTIVGRIIGADNTIPATVELISATGSLRTDLDSRRGTVTAEGLFDFTDVPYGSYVLRATQYREFATQRVIAGFSILLAKPGMPVPPLSSEPGRWAEENVVVDDSGPPAISLSLAAAARVHGHVTFVGHTDRPAPDRLLATAIVVDPSDGRNIEFPTGRIEADGSFQTAGLPPGRYFVRLGMSLMPWSLESVSVAGHQTFDNRVDVETTDVDDVVLALTDRPTEVSGAVTDRQGKPLPGASVFVISSDRRSWKDLDVRPTRLVEVRPDQLGFYKVSGMAPGEYFILAVTGDVPEAWQNPSYIERLVAGAAAIQLTAGLMLPKDLVAQPGRSTRKH